MGLDIYKYKVTTKDNSDSNISLNLKNIWEKKLYDKFKEFVFEEEVEYYDIRKFLEDKYPDEKIDFQIVGEEYSDRGNFIKIEIQFLGSDKEGEKIEIPFDDINVFKYKTEIKLPIIEPEVEYQRKGMKQSFYDEFIKGNIWYIKTNTSLTEEEKKELPNKIPNIFSSQNKFKELQSHAEENTQIKNWILDEDELIYLSY